MKYEMIFKALGSKTRMEMLKLLTRRDYHVTGLAKVLGISVPVAAKHVRILEAANLLEKMNFGKTDVLKLKKEKLYDVMESFSEEYEIEVQRGKSMLDALKEVAGIGIKKIGDKEIIASVDDEEGFYLYEVDGKFPTIPINEYKMEESGVIEIKRLVPVLKKRVRVTVSGKRN